MAPSRYEPEAFGWVNSFVDHVVKKMDPMVFKSDIRSVQNTKVQREGTPERYAEALLRNHLFYGFLYEFMEMSSLQWLRERSIPTDHEFVDRYNTMHQYAKSNGEELRKRYAKSVHSITNITPLSNRITVLEEQYAIFAARGDVAFAVLSLMTANRERCAAALFQAEPDKVWNQLWNRVSTEVQILLGLVRLSASPDLHK